MDSCIYVSQSVASFNRLYLSRLYSRIGLNTHDTWVYPKDRVKDIAKTFQLDTLLSCHWKRKAFTWLPFDLASSLEDVLAVFARPKILEHTVYIFHLSSDRLVPVFLTQKLPRFEINYLNALSIRRNYDVMSTHVAMNYTVGVDGSVGRVDLRFNLQYKVRVRKLRPLPTS